MSFLIKTPARAPSSNQHHHGHLARTVLLVDGLLSLGATQTFPGQGWLQGWLLLTPLLSLPPKWSPPPPRAMGAGFFFLPTRLSWKQLRTRAVLVEARPSLVCSFISTLSVVSAPTLHFPCEASA